MKRFGVRPSVSAGMNPQQQTRLLRHVPIFAYQKNREDSMLHDGESVCGGDAACHCHFCSRSFIL